jgi:hypothetical protein
MFCTIGLLYKNNLKQKTMKKSNRKKNVSTIVIACITLAMGSVYAQTNKIAKFSGTTVPTGLAQSGLIEVSGKLGIGTTAPGSKLSIVGGGGGTIDLFVNGRILTGDAGSAGGMWCNSALTQFIGQIEPSIVANTVGIYNNGWRLAVSSGGFVGIGTATPITPLHVESTTALLSRIKRKSGGSDLTAVAEIENGSGIGWRYGVAGTGNGLGIGNGQFYVEKTGFGAAFVISPNKNILINKTAETNSIYKLDVNGEMRANGITVNTTGADFVFAADYNLNKLEYVEQFIKQNHHLPEIPSANEMTANGMNVGELNKTLLQKVEELTLYIIDQNKRIATLELSRNSK